MDTAPLNPWGTPWAQHFRVASEAESAPPTQDGAKEQCVTSPSEVSAAVDAVFSEAMERWSEQYNGAIEARLRALIDAGVPQDDLIVVEYPFSSTYEDGKLRMTQQWAVRLKTAEDRAAEGKKRVTPPEEIRVNIVNLDDCYNAYYINGMLDVESSDRPRMMIANYVFGKTVVGYTDRVLGGYGRQALEHGPDQMPDRYEDIPESWWTEDSFRCPDSRCTDTFHDLDDCRV